MDCAKSQPQSSQLAEPLWTDPDQKSGISMHERISALKKKCRWEMNGRTLSQILTIEDKASIVPNPQQVRVDLVCQFVVVLKIRNFSGNEEVRTGSDKSRLDVGQERIVKLVNICHVFMRIFVLCS